MRLLAIVGTSCVVGAATTFFLLIAYVIGKLYLAGHSIEPTSPRRRTASTSSSPGFSDSPIPSVRKSRRRSASAGRPASGW